MALATNASSCHVSLSPTHVVVLWLLISCYSFHCRRTTLITNIWLRPRGPQLLNFDAADLKSSIEASFLHHIPIILPSLVLCLEPLRTESFVYFLC